VVNPNDIITPDGAKIKDTRTFKMNWRSVHMTSTGYEKLARGIVEDLASAAFKRTETPTSSLRSLATDKGEVVAELT
jgi:hypothetical protein